MDPVARPVKRTYDNTTRKERSEATRSAVLVSARRLFLERGYRATTVSAVADEAGVNVDTDYALVGRKPVLLRELIEHAISGTDRAVVAEQRDYVRAIQAEPDAGRKLAIYAGAVTRILERMAPLYLALREASSTEPEALEVWQEISERRAVNMRKLVRDVRAAGGLRPGLSVTEAADTVWATNSAELFVLLTRERGWTPARYERWLADTWRRLLLP
jgi:AcrR family transcriptional regulator